MNRFLFNAQRGSALVITLAILTLVCILVVGLSDTMRVERASANMHLERERAADFAQMGVDRVVASLKTNIGDNQRSWVSAPGLLVCSSGGDFKLAKEIPLYSGVSAYSGTAAANCRADCLPPNLNTVMVSATGSISRHLITNRAADPDNAASSTVELPLKWIYIRADGTADPNEPPNLVLDNKANPIIGRFAYWADDESSKVNYNTAWKRPLPTANPPPPTSAINLLGLSNATSTGTTMMTTTMVNALHQAITKSTVPYQFVQRFFNSPQDALLLSGSVTGLGDMLESNKFSLTHYNSDPDTTFFNEPRLVLTTHRQNVTQAADGSYPCIDILKDGAALTVDPGVSTDPNKINTTVNKLMTYMQRTDWPMVSGSGSIQGKYFAGNPKRLAQLALNVIEYVRCRESAKQFLDPIRGDNSTGSFESSESAAGAFQTEYAFMGVSRTPLINELGVWIDDNYTMLDVFAEIYLPPRYGVTSADLTQDPDSGNSPFAFGFSINGSYSAEDNIQQSECIGAQGSKLKAGGYVVIRRRVMLDQLWIPPKFPAKFKDAYPTRPTSVYLRAWLGRAMNYTTVTATTSATPGSRLEIAPLVAYNLVAASNKLDYALSLDTPSGIVEADAYLKTPSKEVDDPRVNKSRDDWQLCNGKANSFDGQNTRYRIKQAPDSVTPQQDTDSSGMLSDASLYMPPPNSSGLVLYPAELGVIHTGVQASGTHGTPWRTLRLQPSKDDLTVVPDWAFMDLFTAPNTAQMQTAAKPLFAPHGNSVGGRVSVNAQVQPFGNANYPACAIPLERVDPMVAALYSGSYTISGTGKAISLTDAKILARAIYDHQLATDAAGSTIGKNFSQANLPGSLSKFYTSPGELAEIKGVADAGEETEMRLCFASNVVTTRGNVFSIYTIGQSLKQTPDPKGRLVVRGEQRLQSMVERYLDSSSGTVKFRTVYFRNLTP